MTDKFYFAKDEQQYFSVALGFLSTDSVKYYGTKNYSIAFT